MDWMSSQGVREGPGVWSKTKTQWMLNVACYQLEMSPSVHRFVTAIDNTRPRYLDVTVRHMRYLLQSSLWQYTDVCLSHVIYTVSLSIQGCGRLQSIWNTWYTRWYDLSFRPHSFKWYSSSPSSAMLSKLLYTRQNFSKLKFLPGVVAQTLTAERPLFLVCSF